MKVSFESKVQKQLKLQGREIGGHPDEIIRSFYRVLTTKLLSGDSYCQMMVDVHSQRPEMDETHLVNLWFRAIQWVMCQRNQSDYQQWHDTEWKKYLDSQGVSDIEDIKLILLTQNTATHVLERYRSLASLVRLKKAASVLDIGCSLGLGLKAAVSNGILNKNSFTDETPGQQILTSLTNPPVVARAVGIDIKIPSLEWVKACNYPSRYQNDGKKLEETDFLLKSVRVSLFQADITKLDFDLLKKDGHQSFDVVHSAMTTYELSKRDQKHVLKTVSDLLVDGGVYLEFTFKNPKNWFEGIYSLVRIKRSSNLSEALIWHEWSDSRCSRVKPGRDWQAVNHLLGL